MIFFSSSLFAGLSIVYSFKSNANAILIVNKFKYKNAIFLENLLTLFHLSDNITLVPNEQDDPLAQSVEQRTVNPCVAGSSPAGVVGYILW